MRVLVDYRPALRARSGVGEYAHQLVAALLRSQPVEVTIFSSSWKDRLTVAPELAGSAAADLRIPVSLLNLAWHRLEWPPAELLTGRPFDVTHSLHPLRLPSRRAASVITIHDLDFLAHPERTSAEIRRDYPPLAGVHARAADGIVVTSRFTAGEVERQFGVPAEHIAVCSPGAPDWRPRRAAPPGGVILFLGTLTPRKNVGTLLDAYERLAADADRASGAQLPDLVLAGQVTSESTPWLERLARPPLARRARHIGYVAPEQRQALYASAAVLVQPSFEEGFGIPVLEAMTLGVPVVAANRGALPEVLGDAGLLVPPEDSEQMAAAIRRVVSDAAFAAGCAERGVERSRRFTWTDTAARVTDVYRHAIRRHARAALAS